MTVETVDRERYRLIRIQGFLDGYTAESTALKQLIEEALPDVRAHHVLDLSTVEYVNSSMLGLFLRFLHGAQENDRQVVLLNPPRSVANVLDLTGLSSLLPVVDSEEAVPPMLKRKTTRRVAKKAVDYDALSDEIETMIKGDAPTDDGESQLGRLLGE